jgi:hypothetical protein
MLVQFDPKDHEELISFVGFLAPLFLLSLSNYKLPHYIYCVMPFASILTAQRLESLLSSNKFKTILILHICVISILLIFVSCVKFLIIPEINIFQVLTILAFIISITFSIFLSDRHHRFLIPSITGTFIISIIINIEILRPLSLYQSESEAAKYLSDNFYDGSPIILFNQNKGAKSRSFNFYLNTNTLYIDDFEILIKDYKFKNAYIFTNENEFQKIIDTFDKVKLLKVFEHFRVSKVNFKFLNHSTRNDVVQKKYLIEVG